MGTQHVAASSVPGRKIVVEKSTGIDHAPLLRAGHGEDLGDVDGEAIAHCCKQRTRG